MKPSDKGIHQIVKSLIGNYLERVDKSIVMDNNPCQYVGKEVTTNLKECLKEGPNLCEYLMDYGYKPFCVYELRVKKRC